MFGKIIITAILVWISYLIVLKRHFFVSLLWQWFFSWISTQNAVILFALLLFIFAIIYLTWGLWTLLWPINMFF